MVRRLKQTLLALGDVFLFYLSLYLALWIRFGSNFDSSIFAEHLLPFTIVFLIWLVVFFIAGLYSMGSVWNFHKALRGLVNSMAVNAVIAFLFFYLIPYFSITPKTILFLDLIVFTILFGGWRFLYSRIIRSIGATSNLILIGAQEASLELAEKVLKHPELGYSLIAIFNLNGRKIPGWSGDSGVLMGESLAQLKKLLNGGKITTVVVDNEVYPKIFEALYALLPTGVDFYNISDFWEDLNRSIPTSATNEIWFLENLRGLKKSFYEGRKRTMDALFSVVLGVPTALISLFVILAIKFDDGGPIFYWQRRVGKDGEIFQMVKFRTMIPNAEKSGAQWATENDPRITRVGKILRLIRLDELPQLWNVLRGEMSFIGPRPERPEFVKKLEKEIPHYSLRHLIRPGLSGWAQVNYSYGSSEEDAERKLRYDLYYLSHRSLLLDVEIALRTITTMLSRAGR